MRPDFWRCVPRIAIKLLLYVLEAQGFVGAGCVSYNATGGGRRQGICAAMPSSPRATVLVPGLGLITGLCETAQAGFMIECAPGADVVGGRLDGIVEYRIAG